MLNLDFSNVPSREPLEEGLYALRIVKAEQKLSKQNNTPMLSVEYDVLEVDGKRKVWDNYPLTAAAMWKVQELMKALGFESDAILSIEETELIGLELTAKIIKEEYNGEETNRVKKLYPAGAIS